MGQKCSCLVKEDENSIEKKLEDETFNRINITKNQSNREEILNESLILSKNKAKAEQHKINSDRNNHYSNGLEADNYLKTDNSLKNEKTILNEKQTLDKKSTRKQYDLDKISMIKRNMGNWFYKKRFVEQVKEGLVEFNEKIFQNLISSEDVSKLEALCAKCKKPFSIDHWKNYYKEFPISLNNFYFSGKKLNKNNGVNSDFIFGKTYKSKKIFLGKNYVNNAKKQDSNSDIKIINYNNDDYRSNANDNSSNSLIAIKDKGNVNYPEEYNKNDKNKDVKNYVYIGDVNKFNQKHGKGVLYYLDGSSREEGTWYEDVLVGWVRVIFSAGNGLVIEGIYQNGSFNGKGKIFSLDESTVYEGDLQNSKKHGFGTETTPEQKFEGEFSENKKCGKGQISFTKSGDFFEGEFKENKMFYGKYTWSDNGNIYEGSFFNNKMHGKGKYTWKDNGNVYEGEYKEGKKHGFGVIKENDKIIYEGEFFDGNPHGKGVRYDKKGVRIEVTMEHGKKVKDAVDRHKSQSPKKIGLKQRIIQNKNNE